jgi:aspartyl-tRNA(Asn)/glutamyl-tRNA(Gln) amidotransferase subunit B
MEYKPTIGLEVHIELRTKSKMFCRCKNDSEENQPNTNVCPVCMAHPGTLPVPNVEAIRHVLKVGKALGSKLADFTEFDRKNYFYPDIPKGYQISQFKYPLVEGGELAGVELTRIHLEEDTARSQHTGSGESLIDYNRAGVPLMELVTEPVITSAKQAGDFARALQLLVGPEYLHISEANMEKGEMRVEANISLNMGTKVEVKNLNTISGMEKAIEFELARQQELLEHGDVVIQETRGFDENTGKTYSQRKKESSHDYRYFPDPDLPKLYISQIPELQNLDLPELPWAKKERLLTMGIKESDVDIFVADGLLNNIFEVSMAILKDQKYAQLAANYLTSDFAGMRKNNPQINIPHAGSFAELIKMVEGGEISSRGAKDILAIMVTEGGNARSIAETKGLFQKSDEGALVAIVEQVISENPQVVADYKAGNEKLLQFFIGQSMKLSKGSANPAVLTKLFKEKI